MRWPNAALNPLTRPLLGQDSVSVISLKTSSGCLDDVNYWTSMVIVVTGLSWPRPMTWWPGVGVQVVV